MKAKKGYTIHGQQVGIIKLDRCAMHYLYMFKWDQIVNDAFNEEKNLTEISIHFVTNLIAN